MGSGGPRAVAGNRAAVGNADNTYKAYGNPLAHLICAVSHFTPNVRSDKT